MSSRYRVDYHLKDHRRDDLVQWIKALLATPFVLGAGNGAAAAVETAAVADHYADVFTNLEQLIAEHCTSPTTSRLSQLVPSVGTFFTPLPVTRAFRIQDECRRISARQLVAPSFNDIRVILNTAQTLQLAEQGLHLVTFDGDITLYDDGDNLEHDSHLLPYIIRILSKGIYIGIVTAAGYTDAVDYEKRLVGLVDTVRDSTTLTNQQRENLFVMGGEANYLFRYSNEAKGLSVLDPDTWLLPDMKAWSHTDISDVLEFGHTLLLELIQTHNLPARVMRKHRAVGLIPNSPDHPIMREQLEECVLQVDHALRRFPPAQNIKWCAFNGGADVWIDIGDKSLGVKVLQKFIGAQMTPPLPQQHLSPSTTLHVGDQFASVGSNDYASRTAATTAWIASPHETHLLLKELVSYLDQQ